MCWNDIKKYLWLRQESVKSVTEKEKGKIRDFLNYKLTRNEIAIKINKLKTVVHNFFLFVDLM